MAVIPNSNVNLATNIRDVLNAAGGSVTNDVITFFKPEAKINPFSKHKPVVLNTNFCQDFDSSKPNYDADWWKGNDNMCGLIFKVVINRDDIVSSQDGGMNGWSYRLPKGGSSEPFRLGDFCGYDSDANPPLYNFTVYPTTVSKNETITGTCLQNVGSLSELSFADTSLSSCYFGMYLVHSGGVYKRFITAAVPLSNGNGNIVELTNDTLNTGSWTAYPCLSSIKYTSPTDSEKAGSYYTLPMCNPVTFRAVAQKSYINCKAEWHGSNGIRNELVITTLTLSSSTATSYKNNYLQIRYATNSFTDPMQVGEKSIKLEDVPSVTDFLFDISGLRFGMVDGLDFLADYKIIVSLGSGNLVQEFEIEDLSNI